MGGVDVSGDSAYALLPADQGQKSPIPEEEKKKELQANILSWRKLSKEKKEVCRKLHTLSYLTPAILDQVYQVREKELVCYSCLCYSF